MRLTNIDTESFLGIDSDGKGNFRSGVPSDVAVFVGANGCGKSILLEQIAWAASGSVASSVTRIRHGMASFGNKFRRSKLEFTFGKYTFGIEFSDDGPNNVVNKTQGTAPEKGVVLYFPSFRKLPGRTDRIQDLSFTTGGRLSSFDEGQASVFERTLVSLSNKEIQAKHHGLGATQAAATLRRIRNAYAVMFPEIELSGTFGTEFLVKKDGASFPLAMLSHGEQQALMLFSFVAKEPELDSSLLVVDEPDIGISREHRKKVVPALQAMGNSLQVLVATHSQEVIDSVDPTKVIPLSG